LGTGEANHWTAWLTALETYTSHLEPLATPVGELFAVVAEHLLLRTLGVEAVVTVTPNPSKLLAKRSTVRDAMDAAKIGAVGLRYVRDAIGASDDDAPTEDELAILRLVPREPGREPAAEETPGPPAESADSPVAASLAAPAVPALPRGDARGELVGAMAIAASVARGRVGSRVRNALSNGDRPVVDGVDNREVAARLGLEHVRQLISVDQVVLDALDGFESWWSARQGAGPARTSAVLFATHLIDTLSQPHDELDPAPAGLVDLLMGLAAKGDNDAA
jgi:hypothetical protein